jgi:transcriptional regulator with GAF, ATPase, and Fis domain
LDDMTGSEATGRPKERLLARALVELADTLVADFDMLEFLHGLTARCVELLDAAAAGLAVTDQRGRLRVIASSSEQARLLELFELQNHEGPCLVCFRTGEPVTDPDLGQVNQLWPRFAAQAQNSGFRSVHVVPMRLREEIIGSLILFRTDPGHLTEEDAHAGRALADVGTIGILQERAVRERAVLDEQLETALDSRVIIEQAKGILAERGRIGMHEAFSRLCDYARGRNQPPPRGSARRHRGPGRHRERHRLGVRPAARHSPGVAPLDPAGTSPTPGPDEQERLTGDACHTSPEPM